MKALYAIGCFQQERTEAVDATGDAGVRAALQSRAGHESALVREHVEWALAQEKFE